MTTKANPGNKQTTHKNHYVPRFYLKYWSRNGSTIWTYDTLVKNHAQKPWRSSCIKTTSVWEDFYSHNIDGMTDDEFESYLNKEYETPACKPFGKIQKDEALTANELARIVNFAIAQMVRTPGWLNRSSEIIRDIFSETLEEILRDLEEKLKHSSPDEIEKTIPSDTEVDGILSRFEMPLDITVNPEDCTIKASTIIGRSSYLHDALRALNGPIAETLRTYNWVIKKAPEGMFFLTSDNPFVVAGISRDSVNLKSGIGVRNVNIFMPLTPHYVLFTEVGRTQEYLYDFNLGPNHVDLFNELTIKNATRYIYSIEPYENIERIRPRTVDKDLFDKAQHERDNWNSIQNEIEQDFGFAS